MLQKSVLLSLTLAGILLPGVSSFSAEPQNPPQNASAESAKKPSELSPREKKYAEFSPLPDASGEEKAVQEKIRVLSGKKLELLKKMHETRMELIRKDQRLSTLRKRILSLSLELSQELNAKREMMALNEELASLEEEMRDLLKKSASAEEQKKELSKKSASSPEEQKPSGKQ
ncbi:MAG: hypothetical protein J6A21_08270 [Lentisphaeria bacterium]|nr:hypothetical protein [Lentisphaeria bacterium]